MRIGIEGRTLQGRRYGVARYTKNLLSWFVRLEPENHYILYLSEPIDLRGFDQANLSFQVIGSDRIPLAWRHLYLPLRMKRDKVDIHFSPSYFVPLFKVCPYVVVVHDISFKAHPEWFARDLRMKFDDLFWPRVRAAERIITVSEYSKKEIVRLLGADPEKITVIYEAAEEFFKPIEDKERLKSIMEKYGVSEPFILTAGSIHTRRNLERLIEAVAIAGRRLGLTPWLLILGTPAPFSPPVDIWGTAAKFGIQQFIQHIEYVPEEDLLLLYNACALFAYPSLYEGFGLPVIEAMACGCPVLCSNLTSLPEVGGEAVVYFDPFEVESIAQAICEIFEDDNLKNRLKEEGKKRASSFSWERAARETLKVFHEIAG